MYLGEVATVEDERNQRFTFDLIHQVLMSLLLFSGLKGFRGIPLKASHGHLCNITCCHDFFTL